MTKFSDVVLFACAGLHLSGGTILAGSAAWALFKMSYYFSTTELGAELGGGVAVLAGGLLCLPVCWLITIVPYNKKSYVLPATLMCLAATALLLLSAGMQYTAALSRSLRDPAAFNASMLRAMHRDAVDPSARSAYSSMQLELQCCGVESYKDWYQHRQTLPPSCCARVANSKGGPLCTEPTFMSGCLRPAMAELRAYSNSTALFCGILVLTMTVTLLIAALQLSSTALEKENLYNKQSNKTCTSPPFAAVTAPVLLASQPPLHAV